MFITSQQYFFSERNSHQQSANSTFLSKQISINHQPSAKRTGCLSLMGDGATSLPNLWSPDRDNPGIHGHVESCKR
jgi:hypothetical protein